MANANKYCNLEDRFCSWWTVFCSFRDLSGNPLVCDCELGWLLEWAQNVSVKLMSSPKCGGPPALRGQPIRKLRLGTDLHCDWPAAGSSHGTLLELKPAHSQVWKQILLMRLAVVLTSVCGLWAFLASLFQARMRESIQWDFLLPLLMACECHQTRCLMWILGYGGDLVFL